MPQLKDISVAAPADAPAAGGSPKLHPRRRSPVAITTLVLTVLLVALGALWWLHTTGREETDNAYVEGHISYVSPRISGTVTKVLVEEHETVKGGQLLVVLDPGDQQVKLSESRALLEQTEKQAVAAKDKIHQTALSLFVLNFGVNWTLGNLGLSDTATGPWGTSG